MNDILTGMDKSAHGKRQKFLRALEILLQNPEHEEYATLALECAKDADYAMMHTRPSYSAQAREEEMRKTLNNLIKKEEHAWMELLFMVSKEEWYTKLKLLSPFKDKILVFTPTDPDDFGVRGDTEALSEFLVSLGIGHTIAEGRAMAYVLRNNSEMSEGEYCEQCLLAQQDLDSARDPKNQKCVAGYIENVRSCLL